MDSRAAGVAIVCLASLVSASALCAAEGDTVVRVQPNREPRVKLTEPRQGAQFNAPSSILLEAHARDRDHNLVRVEFYADETLIGTSTTEPYLLNWGPVPGGEHVLVAKAIDAMGATDESRPVTIRVTGNRAPVVSLASPANGTLFGGPGPITLDANAADADGDLARVDFFSGESHIGSATAPPYSIIWANTVAGTYTLTAQAIDAKGLVATSAAISITVNALPSASLTSPAQNAVFTAPANIPITADVTDSDGAISSVEFYFGTTLIATRTTPPYSIVWTGVPQGRYSLSARAIDNNGGVVASALVEISVNTGVPKLYFIHVDHLNTPRLVADDQQKTVWRWDQQEPFGSTAPDENPGALGTFDLPLRLPGQYFDRETGLHYSFLRDCYDAGTGRFCQSDPIGLKGGLNTYLYGMANPLSFIDPTGLAVWMCTRKLAVALPGNHTYLWDDSTNKCCGRVPGADPLRDCKEKGPGSDFCVRVEGSDGKESEMLKCCDARARRGTYIPFFNDCVNTAEDCVRQSGLKVPAGPAGGSRTGSCPSCFSLQDPPLPQAP